MLWPGEPIAPLLNTNPAQTLHHQTSQLATSPAHFPVTVVGGENVAPGYNTVPAQVRRYCLCTFWISTLSTYTIYISTDRRAREPPPDRAAAAAPAADRRPDHPGIYRVSSKTVYTCSLFVNCASHAGPIIKWSIYFFSWIKIDAKNGITLKN